MPRTPITPAHGSKSSGNSATKECKRRELDEDSVRELIEFFRILDKWDREAKAKQNESQSGDAGAQDLGQNWVKNVPKTN